MNDVSESVRRKRNDAARYIELLTRHHRNCIRVGNNETVPHRLAKIIIAAGCMNLGQEIYTEANWEKPFKGRADIVILDTFEVVEILENETPAQYQEKIKTYPTEVFDVKAMEAGDVIRIFKDFMLHVDIDINRALDKTSYIR